MLGAFPSMQRLDKSTALSITLGYLWTVRERPHWAIVRAGAVAGLVGIDGDVVSGVFNLESSDVRASDWRPRHDEHYHEA